jgi:hypothetical protein
MKCNNCDSVESETISFVRCKKCGRLIQDFFERPPEGFKLTIRQHKVSKELEIVGNAAGLRFLASRCLNIIGATEPSAHILLDPFMYNLSYGSIPTILQYSEDKEGHIPFAATGKPHPDGTIPSISQYEQAELNPKKKKSRTNKTVEKRKK